MNDLKIENILGLEKPLVKFLEVTSKGIGKLYEPTHQKRMLKVDVEKIKMLSKAIEENLSLPIKYSSEELLIDTTSMEELAKRAQGRLVYQEIVKQNNIENTLCKTYNLLKNVKSVSDEKVNDDWILRFFNSIEDISDEKMQEIWAKNSCRRNSTSKIHLFKNFRKIKEYFFRRSIKFSRNM